jgi:IS5 family transposase
MLSCAIANRQRILNGNALVALHLDALIPKPHLHLITVSPDRTDEITVCKFRHSLEEHQLGEQILGTVNLHLQAQGANHDRHDRGRDHPARTHFDQEPRTAT